MIASVALFSELYDSDRDIYDIIAELIKGAIQVEGRWTLSSTEMVRLFNDVYGFDVPEAVLATAAKKRLKKEGYLSFNKGIYSATEKLMCATRDIEKELSERKVVYRRIINSLIVYVEKKTKKELDDVKKDNIKNLFNEFLLGHYISDENGKHISSFIVSNQGDKEFVSELNTIKEGLVIYSGIRYTPDLNQLGVWSTSLTIYLDTEHLFNAVGYNGVVYRSIFQDFLKLINEINAQNKNKKRRGRVLLKYFEENKTAVENFFYAAEKTLRNKNSVDPSKTAMLSILNGCRSPSDVVNKKTTFFSDLKYMGISLEDSEIDYYENYELNVESEEAIIKLEKASKNGVKYFNEEECHHFLKIFTKINVLRKGVNNVFFDDAGYVFLTGNRTAIFYSNSSIVKFKEKDTPFATDINFVTNRFWFKLKKGFGNSNTLPRSFDVITNAQIIVSSLVNKSVSCRYESLLQDLGSGKISKERAVEMSYALRERRSKPEDITLDSINDQLKFIDEEDFERYLREKEGLLRLVQEGENAKLELKKRKELDKLRELEEQEAMYTAKRKEFIEESWKKSRKRQNSNLMYLGLVWLPEAVVVFLAFWVKEVGYFFDFWLLENEYYFLLLLVVFVSLFQVVKSYIIDKARVKSGWEWLKSFFLKKHREDIKRAENERSALAFEQIHEKPSMMV